MGLYKVGTKYYRIDCAVWNPKTEEYELEVGTKEYETEKSARIALGHKKVTPDAIQYDLMEYEYDRYGLTCNQNRLLVKDEFGVYAD